MAKGKLREIMSRHDADPILSPQYRVILVGYERGKDLIAYMAKRGAGNPKS